MIYFIKKDYDLSKLKNYGFSEDNDRYYRIQQREIVVWKNTRELIDYKFDRTTYSGYAYETEYNHNTPLYTQDLIKDDLVIRKKYTY